MKGIGKYFAIIMVLLLGVCGMWNGMEDNYAKGSFFYANATLIVALMILNENLKEA
jgi:hypothetical protein